MPTVTAGPGLDLAVRALLGTLSPVLPAPSAGLPAPQIVVATLAERSVGVGGRTGLRRSGGFDAVEIKGVRLEAAVRFEVWAGDRAGAADAAGDLGMRLLAARDPLRAQGVLRLDLESAEPPTELIGTGWQAAPVYGVLFETEYVDMANSSGLIARIPIRLGAEHGTVAAETTTVTDAMVRWDSADSPTLDVAGRRTISGLAAVWRLPVPPPSGSVLVTRTVQGAPGAPTAFTDLVTFLDAVAGQDPPVTHAQLELASIESLLADFVVDAVPVWLGRTDGDAPEVYTAGELPFDPAITLQSGADHLRITHGPADGLDQPAVIYLRALPPDGG